MKAWTKRVSHLDHLPLAPLSVRLGINGGTSLSCSGFQAHGI